MKWIMDLKIDLFGGKSLQDNITNFYLGKSSDDLMAQIYAGHYVFDVIYREASGVNGREDFLDIMLFIPNQHNHYEHRDGTCIDVEELYKMIFVMNETEVEEAVRNSIKYLLFSKMPKINLQDIS